MLSKFCKMYDQLISSAFRILRCQRIAYSAPISGASFKIFCRLNKYEPWSRQYGSPSFDMEVKVAVTSSSSSLELVMIQIVL